MSIPGVGEMDADQLDHEVHQGAKFVVFQYCISILILTFKRSSSVQYLRSGENHAGKALP